MFFCCCFTGRGNVTRDQFSVALSTICQTGYEFDICKHKLSTICQTTICKLCPKLLLYIFEDPFLSKLLLQKLVPFERHFPARSRLHVSFYASTNALFVSERDAFLRWAPCTSSRSSTLVEQERCAGGNPVAVAWICGGGSLPSRAKSRRKAEVTSTVCHEACSPRAHSSDHCRRTRSTPF